MYLNNTLAYSTILTEMTLPVSRLDTIYKGLSLCLSASRYSYSLEYYNARCNDYDQIFGNVFRAFILALVNSDNNLCTSNDTRVGIEPNLCRSIFKIVPILINRIHTIMQ
jgi:hypothetical protein